MEPKTTDILAPLRIPWTGARRWELAEYGSAYRPGCIKPCPWTGYCFDDDLLDTIQECARAGMRPKDIARAVRDRAYELWSDEIESQCTADYFVDHAEANGYEFDDLGRMA